MEGKQVDQVDWEARYQVEEELNQIYEMEELFWQKRGGETWLLQGDANTGYFHGIANGRKRKCFIRSLVERDRVLTDSQDLKRHVTDFYKKPFGSEEQPMIKLHAEIWRDHLTGVNGG